MKFRRNWELRVNAEARNHMNSYPDAIASFTRLSEEFTLDGLHPTTTRELFTEFLSERMASWIAVEASLSEAARGKILEYVHDAKMSTRGSIPDADLDQIRCRAWSEHDAAEGIEKHALRVVVCGLTRGAVKSMDGGSEHATTDFLSLIFGLLARVDSQLVGDFLEFLVDHPRMAHLRTRQDGG